MKLLVDMNLLPRWVEALQAVGVEARHWSTVGAPTARVASTVGHLARTLADGAVATIEPARERVRVLPLRPDRPT